MKSPDRWHINLDQVAVPLNTMTMHSGSTMTVNAADGAKLMTVPADKWPLCPMRGCNRYMDDVEYDGKWYRFTCIKHRQHSYLYSKDMKPISEAFIVDNKFDPDGWEPIDGSYPPDWD
jgi:hypothetical protein